MGLDNARGSGTSGYVQKNLLSNSKITGHHRNRKASKLDLDLKNKQKLISHKREASKLKFLNHDVMREIEIKTVELEEILTEKKTPKDKIEAEVERLRHTLLDQQSKVKVDDAKLEKLHGQSNDELKKYDYIPRYNNESKERWASKRS